MKKTAFVFAFFATVILVHAAPEIGKAAPVFSLKDENGKDVSLADFKGKTVVLEWYNYGCPFVVKHYKSGTMQRLQKAATDEGTIWLSIISSAPGKQGYIAPADTAAKKKEQGLHSTALLVDEDGKIGKLYHAKTTPDMFVINGDGVLVYKGAIDDKPSPDPATVEGATSYVGNALAALKNGKPVEPAETKSYGCPVKY